VPTYRKKNRMQRRKRNFSLETVLLLKVNHLRAGKKRRLLLLCNPTFEIKAVPSTLSLLVL